MSWEDDIEHRWEIRGAWPHWTAKHVQEIPPERGEDLSDTMAPMEDLTSVLGCTVPWTLSAFTRRGLERRMRRYEKRHGFVGERCLLPPTFPNELPRVPDPNAHRGPQIPAPTPKNIDIENPWGRR